MIQLVLLSLGKMLLATAPSPAGFNRAACPSASGSRGYWAFEGGGSKGLQEQKRAPKVGSSGKAVGCA